MAKEMKLHSWRSKLTGKWVEGTPYDYDAADRLRAHYTLPSGPRKGKEQFIQIKRWPDRPGLTAQQQTEFIESKLPVYFNHYLRSNG